MKRTFIVAASIVLLTLTGHARAQSSTTASASQQSTSSSTAQGTIQFSQTPADTHSTETIRNVSAPVLGAYAGSFSQMNCASTVQVGGAIAGVSLVGGASRDSQSCVLEVAAAELTRQSTVDQANAAALQKAAINVRCQISSEVYNAMVAAGFDCSLKPKELQSRTDTQPANYRVAER